MLFIFLCLFQPICAAEIEGDWYKKIVTQSLHTVPWQDNDWDTKGFCDFLTQAYAVQKNLQPFRLRKFAFEIVNRATADAVEAPCTIVQDMHTWEDIGLFHGRLPEDPYVGSLIDRSCTEFGKVTLLRMLLPTDDIATIYKRQSAVQALLSNPEALEEIRSCLAEIAYTQNLLLSFWINDPLSNPIDEYYFDYAFLDRFNSRLNQNCGIMCIKSFLQHQYRVGNLAMIVGAAVVPIAYYVWQHLGGKPSDGFVQLNDRCKRDADVISFLLSFFKDARMQEAAHVFSAGLCALQLKNTHDWVKGHFLLMTILQERLMHVRRFLNASFKLGRIIQGNPELCNLLTFVNHLDQCNMETDSVSEFKQLYSLLESETFAGDPSMISNYGKILAAFKWMEAAKVDLEKIIAAAGEVDAFASLATLFDEHATGPARYCFAEFVQDARPMIRMKDAWNPFLDRHKAVVNDIAFGGDVPNHGIITGPNAGGKSTIMKGLFIATWCAQSIGLVPASECVMTPFAHLATYMNITDDIVAGKSLFKAEVMRTHEVLERIKGMDGNSFSLVVMDEIFSGTNPKEGEVAAFSVAKHIGAFDNVICLIATHYPLLKNLANDKLFANYHVSVETRGGRLCYPFKLSAGTSDQCIALDILCEDGFESDIISTARFLLNQ